MIKSCIAICAAALMGLALVSTEASARGGFGGGGFRGGGGFHGGGFRGGPGFRGGFVRGPGFRRFGPGLGIGLGLGLAAGYGYYGYPYGYGGCVAPRRIWTPYGWRVQYVNSCGYGYGYY